MPGDSDDVSSRKYEMLFEQSPFGILVVDPETLKAVEFNTAAHRQLGYSAEEFAQLRISDYEARETPEQIRSHAEMVSREGSDEFETLHRTRDGDVRNVMVTVQTIDVAGKPYFHLVYRDITDQRRREEQLEAALLDSESMRDEVRGLLQAAHSVLEFRSFEDAARAIFDACKGVVGATSGYVALLTPDGTENEVVYLDAGGAPCTVDPELPMPIRGLREVAIRSALPVYDNDFAGSEWVKFLPEGHVPLSNVLFAPLVLEGETRGLFGLAGKEGGFDDEDARVASAFAEVAAVALVNSRTYELLADSEERFHSIAETADDAIISFDVGGEIIFWNRRAEELFDLSPEQARGSPVIDFVLDDVIRNYPDDLRLMAAEGVVGRIRTVETVGRAADGRRFPIEVSIALWESQSRQFFTMIIRDITDRKKAEDDLKKLNVELNGYARTVSHDLKGPLSAVTLALAILRDTAETGNASEISAGVEDAAVSIERTIGRAYSLIDNLLALAQAGQIPTGIVDVRVRGVVDDVLREYERVIEERGVSVTVGDELGTVRANPTHVYQLFLNIIGNAIKHNDSPAPGVWVDYLGPDEAGGYRYIVRDNGSGIPEGETENIFLPFFKIGRTAETGIGLATVDRIVKAYHGEIRAYNGGGACFEFVLRDA